MSIPCRSLPLARLAGALAVLLLQIADAGPVAAGTTPPGGPRPPLVFEPNRGQGDPEARFLARGRGSRFYLTASGAVIALDRPGKPPAIVRLDLAAAAACEPHGEAALDGQSHYYTLDGSRPAIEGVEHFARVRCAAAWPGADVVFYGHDGELEYDFELAPGVTAEAIGFTVRGAATIALDASGDLRVALDGGGDFTLRAPIAYQPAGDGRRPVTASYWLGTGASSATSVRFALGPHDPALPLVIDPVLVYSTYLGGSNIDDIRGIAIGSSPEVFVTGSTQSVDFPLQDPIHGYGGGMEAFASKLASTGASLVYSTYLGNLPSNQVGESIAVNAAGEAWIAGSSNQLDPDYDAFLLKLNANGTLAWSRVYGGSLDDRAKDVVVDASGVAYTVGFTDSSDFPVLNAIQGTYGGNRDGFMRRYDSAGKPPVLDLPRQRLHPGRRGGGDRRQQQHPRGRLDVGARHRR